MKLKTLATGCGAGLLLTLPYLLPWLSPDNLALYHSHLPASNLVGGVLIDLAIASLFAILIFGLLESRDADSALGSIAWAVVAGKLLSICFYGASLLRGRLFIRHQSAWAFAGGFLAMLVLRWSLRHVYRGIARGLHEAMFFAGFSVLWIVPFLLYQAVRPVFPETLPQLLPTGKGDTGSARPERRSRVVWLLFDELSYDQTFEHRFPGLAMPFFDRLKGQSIVFTNLAPAGYYTERVVPSLFLGKTVEAVKSDLSGFPSFRFAGQRGWLRFNSQDTLFADAQHNGWTTGVAGWFNPYCRILRGTLDFCFWRDVSQPDGASTERDVMENAAAPIGVRWQQFLGEPSASEQNHKRDYMLLMQQSEALIRDEQIRFLFIHLPVPHPPSIYDRKTGVLRPGGSYIDNLALADRTLGELLSVLGKTPSSGQTLLIVCSDHSWRTPLWKSSPDWTAEDQAASGGKFDPRPMLMIHYPGQLHEMDVNQHFSELRLYAILEGLLHGGFASPDELRAWLESSYSAPASTTELRNP